MAKALKQSILRLLTLPRVAPALSALTRTQATIFMLHRFAVPYLGIPGHDPKALRRNLDSIRKAGYVFLSLEDLLQRLRSGETVTRAVAFTIDDGYFDQAEIAAPIFVECNCPVTCFVTTGFLDRQVWFWWDRLMTIFEKTKRRELMARVGQTEVRYRWDSCASRRQAWWDLNLRCQDASEADRVACIEQLSCDAEVELPATPPARFAPMSWETARRLEPHGVRFGPHTVTHPVLCATSAAQAEWEITESWKRLNAEVARPVPVFCYPNGRSQDVSEREISTIRRLGLWGGLMAHPGKLEAGELQRSDAVRYRIPRCGYSDDLAQNLQCLAGVDRLKSLLRGRAGSAGVQQ
jgi:peptidoglycan/xylan/chitin deacetylase (PgdA/CDA1 family)